MHRARVAVGEGEQLGLGVGGTISKERDGTVNVVAKKEKGEDLCLKGKALAKPEVGHLALHLLD